MRPGCDWQHNSGIFLSISNTLFQFFHASPSSSPTRLAALGWLLSTLFSVCLPSPVTCIGILCRKPVIIPFLFFGCRMWKHLPPSGILPSPAQCIPQAPWNDNASGFLRHRSFWTGCPAPHPVSQKRMKFRTLITSLYTLQVFNRQYKNVLDKDGRAEDCTFLFFVSPSIPPKVIDGLLGAKKPNRPRPEHIPYPHGYNGRIKAVWKGHASQLVMVLMSFFNWRNWF